MKESSNAAAQLCRVLSQEIIPQVEMKNNVRMVVAQRPSHLPPGITAKRQPAPSLKMSSKNRSGWFLAQDKQEAMHALRVPYLCFVVEGEIEMRLGIPAQNGKTRGIVNSYEILTLPANSFLFIPPGVFFPESGAHWERKGIPIANSHLFWLHILPIGALCHTCATKNGTHSIFVNRDVFVPDPQLATLTDILSDELQSTNADSHDSASSALLLLLLRVRNCLRRGNAGEWNSHNQLLSKTPRPEVASLSTNDAIVEKACNYIQKHLSGDIDQIASQVYVSSSHLTKLFRIHLKTTVKKYVLGQRMEVARSFLMNTEISLKEITHFVGYKQPPQFSRVFKQIHGVTPKEFRQKHHRHGK